MSTDINVEYFSVDMITSGTVKKWTHLFTSDSLEFHNTVNGNFTSRDGFWEDYTTIEVTKANPNNPEHIDWIISTWSQDKQYISIQFAGSTGNAISDAPTVTIPVIINVRDPLSDVVAIEAILQIYPSANINDA